MNIERERRWLVRPEAIPAQMLQAEGAYLTQGYLSPARVFPVIRVRLFRDAPGQAPNRAVQTVKAPAQDGLAEVEFDIPVARAQELMDLSLGRLEKTRYTWPVAGELAYEIDLFHGPALEGLAIVEIELPSLDCPLEIPAWFGPEVTGVNQLSNVALVYQPKVALGVAAARWAAHDTAEA